MIATMLLCQFQTSKGKQDWDKIKDQLSNNILDALDKTIMPDIKENAQDIFFNDAERF